MPEAWQAVSAGARVGHHCARNRGNEQTVLPPRVIDARRVYTSSHARDVSLLMCLRAMISVNDVLGTTCVYWRNAILGMARQKSE